MSRNLKNAAILAYGIFLGKGDCAPLPETIFVSLSMLICAWAVGALIDLILPVGANKEGSNT